MKNWYPNCNYLYYVHSKLIGDLFNLVINSAFSEKFICKKVILNFTYLVSGVFFVLILIYKFKFLSLSIETNCLKYVK